MKKRILPALLALCMVMSLLPVTFAANPVTTTEDVSCSAVPATKPADVKETVDEVEVTTTVTLPQNTNPHGSVRCAASGCKCVTKTTTTTETAAVPAQGTEGQDGYVAAQPAKKTIEITYEYKNSLCAACLASATCNPCTGKADCAAATHKATCLNTCGHSTNVGEGKTGVAGCTLVKGHDGPHNVKVCTKDEKCPVTGTGIHDANCPKACANAQQNGATGCTLTAGHTQAHNVATCTNDARCAHTGSAHNANCPKSCEVSACTKTAGHTDKHTGDTCTKDSRCPATTHTAPVYTDEEMTTVKTAGCPKFAACTVCTPSGDAQNGYTPKAASHTDAHNNTEKCLGYANDKRCGAAGHHIAGCPNYCTCDDPQDKHEGCTHQAGCPVCALLADCDCPVCKASPNPGLGVVTDENGEAVDPAEPTEPEIPTKAEDFTDMEDWMAADVQTVLDKGWMQGEGETFNGRGVTKGATIAAVLARMDGETITGTDWDKDALAWAEGKDVFEGVELTGESMARKDLVLVIWRMADKPDSDFELTFTDVDGLEGDHLTAMKWAAENGIVKGNGDDTVTPDGSVTRAALCAMLARYDGLEK